MTTSLIDTLNGLRADPTLVIQLYSQLFEEAYYALVCPGTEKDLDKMEFLTYETQDKIIELPLFTSEQFIIDTLTQDAVVIQVRGQLF